MVVQLLFAGASKKCMRMIPFGSRGLYETTRIIIGNRDIVGYGVNGNPEYVDCVEYPFPSLRWKETSPAIAALREKEKGDWRKLTIQDKKTLYRSSFCQTFAEFTAPTGQWKSVVGCGVFFAALGIWLFILEAHFAYAKQALPESFSEESKRHQLRRILDIKNNIQTGIGNDWDYEHDTWK